MLLLLSHFSRVQLLATPWTAAYQAPLSMGFSRQEYWSAVPLPSPIGLHSAYKINNYNRGGKKGRGVIKKESTEQVKT